MAIGGAEDRFRNRQVLATFAMLAGGPMANIVVIPTASSIESAGERYKALFLDLGCRNATVLYVADRADANGYAAAEVLSEATGIFITGGNQLRLSSLLGGTQVDKMARERWLDGAVVGGTSAGASILSSHMVAFGASGERPRQRMAQMVAGFGFVEGTIIDQHFRQRDRIGRLLMLVSASPTLLGVGIDEDTAALFGPHGTLDVIGRNSVTIVDGCDIFSDVAEVKRHGGITVSNAKIHMLTAGRRFDMNTRRLHLFNEDRSAVPARVGA
jgi:cyanophycinase